MRDLADLFAALGKSEFRARFALTQSDCAYVLQKSPAIIRQHAQDFVNQRLAPRTHTMTAGKPPCEATRYLWPSTRPPPAAESVFPGGIELTEDKR